MIQWVFHLNDSNHLKLFDQFSDAEFLPSMNPTFKRIQESVRHALIEVLHTLRQFFSTEILQIRTKEYVYLNDYHDPKAAVGR